MSETPRRIDEGLSQGSKANAQGREVLDAILASLDDADFVRVALAREGVSAVVELPQHLGQILVPARGVFAQQVVVCQGIFNDPHRADFLLFGREWASPLALMARHQKSSGSVREKLSYWCELFTTRYPCPALLVVEGPQLAGDREFMRVARERVERSGGRFRHVFAGVYEFRQWLGFDGRFPEFAGGTLPL